jgi:SAM-dependent methyltransferase
MTVIDGHNLYHALDRVDEEHFERGLNLLIQDCRRLLRKGRAILVLDGSGGGHPHGSEKSLSEHLRCVYSGSITADDWIERWELRHRLPTWELVSADRRLYERLRRKGVQLKEPKAWFKKLERDQKPTVSARQILQNGKKSFGSTEEWLDYFS